MNEVIYGSKSKLNEEAFVAVHVIIECIFAGNCDVVLFSI